jgi:hypothetical protein
MSYPILVLVNAMSYLVESIPSTTDRNKEFFLKVMEIVRHLDVAKAVNTFLENFENLSHLPLITDTEMDRLFGQEVQAGLAELERYNRQGNVCRNCPSKCCRLVDCELFAPELTQCPVYPLRPVLCRMHFCHQFDTEYKTLVKETGDVFIESLLAAERRASRKARFFDCPPLSQLAPGLVTAITPLIKAFREGRLKEAAALDLIQAETSKYMLSKKILEL